MYFESEIVASQTISVNVLIYLPLTLIYFKSTYLCNLNIFVFGAP